MTIRHKPKTDTLKRGGLERDSLFFVNIFNYNICAIKNGDSIEQSRRFLSCVVLHVFLYFFFPPKYASSISGLCRRSADLPSIVIEPV